jgi:hypothetical protein
MTQFKEAWLAFKARHGPERMAEAYREMELSGTTGELITLVSGVLDGDPGLGGKFPKPMGGAHG